MEPDPARRHGKLPTELRIGIVRSRQHEQLRAGFGRRIGDAGGWPAELLERSRRAIHLDSLELLHAADWTDRLDPSGIQAGVHSLNLVERVVAALSTPGIALTSATSWRWNVLICSGGALDGPNPM